MTLAELLNRLTAFVALLGDHVPRPAWWPETGYVLAGALLAGIVLSLWGARLLRAIFVLVFMGVGAAIGIRAGRHFEVDDLIGLVLGIGFFGLLGHLLYRWWVGVSAGLALTVVVALIFGVRNLPTIQSEIQQAFPDYRLGVGTGQYVLGQAAVSSEASDTIRAYLSDLGAYLWNTRRQAVYRVGFVLGLAWLTGLGMGLTLPRFTTIIGTSVLGSVVLVVAVAMLMASQWPGAWAAASAHPAWLLAGLGLILIVSVAYQTRHGRPHGVVPLQTIPQAA